jgi:hypothetical protein
MAEPVTLDDVLKLVKQLSTLDKIRLIEQITPQLKRDLVATPSQPRKSLRGIWKGVDISDEDIAEIRAEMNTNFPREDI